MNIVMNAIADMFEVIMSSDSLMPVLVNFAGTPNIADIIRQIPHWMGGFTELSDVLAS